MNEQLVVKNFGPIKDATVDFKRVTVFIGPTGGGKSTLAKLAAIFRDSEFFFTGNEATRASLVGENLALYAIQNFGQMDSDVSWKSLWLVGGFGGEEGGIRFSASIQTAFEAQIGPQLQALSEEYGIITNDLFSTGFAVKLGMKSNEAISAYWKLVSSYFPTLHYIPADRAIAAFVTGAGFQLQSQKAGLASILIDFLGEFEMARASLTKQSTFTIPFLDAQYFQMDGQYLVSVKNKLGESIMPLAESASGFQSVIPMLTVVAFEANRYSASFIIEEPELNLYPTAQQGLLNWLVEKCTKGENDLTITTHSPYILSHLNLLLYAYQVAEQYPDRRAEVAALVPEASWINPKEFACYQVENGGVQSLVNEELGMIDNNELDALSGDAADAFDNLIRLSKGIAVK
ncbi:AAA family ATPase [Hymenobacter ruricola]|uniref:AAA family ATPase n=1 Tax=Hymenobacter ruricola TaxID=2791023 RepID=A0ABS0I9S0_9BACT|nr:AAA family ATPase [Hymenobacter ruricola]MBF9223685.1 AAA family ATPase [Hymenobacter ruricola]